MNVKGKKGDPHLTTALFFRPRVFAVYHEGQAARNFWVLTQLGGNDTLAITLEAALLHFIVIQKDLSTTAIYTTPSQADLANAVEKIAWRDELP